MEHEHVVNGRHCRLRARFHFVSQFGQRLQGSRHDVLPLQKSRLRLTSGFAFRVGEFDMRQVS